MKPLELPSFAQYLSPFSDDLPGIPLPPSFVDDDTGAPRDVPEPMQRYRLVAEDEYHGGPCLSASALKQNTPYQQLLYLLGGEDDSVDEETGKVSSMSGAEGKTTGTLLHIAALEPKRFDTFSAWTVPCPTKTLTSQAAVKTRMENPGKLVLTEDLVAFAYGALHAIAAHPTATQWIQECELREISGFYHWGGVKLRWRPDLCSLNGRILADLKSTRVDLSSREFARFAWHRECWSMGYYLQAGLYCFLHMMLTGIQPDEWRWVVLSKLKGAPHVRTYRMKYLCPGDPGYKESIWAQVNPVIGLFDNPGKIQAWVQCAADTARWQAKNPCVPMPVKQARLIWPMHESEEPTDLTERA